MVNFWFYILLIIYPLGQLTKLPLLIPQANIYLQDFVIVFLVINWLAQKLLNKEKLYFPKFSLALFTLQLVLGFSWLVNVQKHSGAENLVSFAYLGRFLLISMLYFVVADMINKRPKIGQKIKQYLIYIGVVVAILGLLQYIFFPDLRPLTEFGWDPHYFRVVGTFLDPSFTGMILVLTLILLVLNLWHNQKILVNKIFFIVVYASLALTYSRASYLAYLVGMGVIAFVYKSKKFFLVILTAGIITLMILPRPGGEGVKLERQSTILARLNNWKQSLQIASLQPVYGIGFNNYRFIQRDLSFIDRDNWQTTHSGAGADASLFFVLATSGVAGLIVFLLLIKNIIRQKPKTAHLMAISSVWAILAHSFFNNTFFYSWIMIWLWLILAVDDKIYGE